MLNTLYRYDLKFVAHNVCVKYYNDIVYQKEVYLDKETNVIDGEKPIYILLEKIIKEYGLGKLEAEEIQNKVMEDMENVKRAGRTFNAKSILDNIRFYGKKRLQRRLFVRVDVSMRPRKGSSNRNQNQSTSNGGTVSKDTRQRPLERAYQQTDNYRRIQEASRRMSDEEILLYQRGNNKIVGTENYSILAREISEHLDSSRNSLRDIHVLTVDENTGTAIKLYEGVNAYLFHDVLEIVRNYLPNGDSIDLHKAEISNGEENKWAIGYEECICYLTEDGLSGFAITPNRELISMFSLTENGDLFNSIGMFSKTQNVKTVHGYQSDILPLGSIYEKKWDLKRLLF